MSLSVPYFPNGRNLCKKLTPLHAGNSASVCFPLVASIAGILTCLDGYMNIAMEQTEEYVNGQLKNKYGDAFIRGNNGERYFPYMPSMFTISACF